MKKLGIFTSSILSFLWASIYWLGSQNRWQTDWLASANLDKPWVYRQLVPILVRLFQKFSIPTDISTTLIVTLSGVGFYLVLHKLLSYIYGKSLFIDTVSILFVILGLALFGHNRVSYDLPTAFLFTLSYLLIIKGKHSILFVVFPWVVMNRETAFLLVLFYFIYWGLSKRVIYLGAMFLSIQISLHVIFSHNAGLPMWVTPWQNMMDFIADPSRMLIHLSIFTLILWSILYSWKLHDQKLKIGFVCLGILSLLMYLIMGQAFEVRVLWEVYPLACVLSIPTLKEIYYEMQSHQKNQLFNRSEG